MKIKFLLMLLFSAVLFGARDFERTFGGFTYKIHIYQKSAEVEVYNTQGDEVRSYTINLNAYNTLQQPDQIMVIENLSQRNATRDELNFLKDLVGL